jgi:hypothetical protein
MKMRVCVAAVFLILAITFGTDGLNTPWPALDDFMLGLTATLAVHCTVAAARMGVA